MLDLEQTFDRAINPAPTVPPSLISYHLSFLHYCPSTVTVILRAFFAQPD